MSTFAPSDPDRTITEGLFGQDDYFVGAMRINGGPYPVLPQIFRELRVTSNIYSFLPTLHMVCEDPFGRLINEVNRSAGESALGDGAKISLALGKTLKDKLKEHRFRLFSTPQIERTTNSPIIRIRGVIDAMKWWNGLKTGSINNTSAAAIQDMAEDCGLGVHVPHPTNDKMVWISRQQTYSQFATKISSYGWASDESCMAIGMDVDRVVRYVDVSQIAGEQPGFTAKWLTPADPEDENEIPVMDLQVKTSGVANILGAYASRISGVNVDGDQFEIDEAEAVKHGDYLDINTDVKSDISLSRSIIMPMDAGNNHENFARARYQNERIGLTYKVFVDIYYEKVTEARLFDTVRLDMKDPLSNTDNNNYSGVYFVIAKAYGMNGGRYFEKLRLVSNSRNINAKSKMI